MNKAGYTLIEILLTLAILAILGGISTISYQGYNKITLDHTKKDLHTAGKVFVKAVQNCIMATGGWRVEKATGDPDDSTDDIMPCNTGTDSSKLKKLLKFNCPKDAICTPHVNNSTHVNNKTKFYCLKISDNKKKLQILSFVNFNNPSHSEIYCWTGAGITLTNQHCKEKGSNVVARRTGGTTSPPKPKPCEW